MHPASWFAHSKRKKAQLLLLCLVFLACLALLFRSSKTPELFTRRGTSRYDSCSTCGQELEPYASPPPTPTHPPKGLVIVRLGTRAFRNGCTFLRAHKAGDAK